MAAQIKSATICPAIETHDLTTLSRTRPGVSTTKSISAFWLPYGQPKVGLTEMHKCSAPGRGWRARSSFGSGMRGWSRSCPGCARPACLSAGCTPQSQTRLHPEPDSAPTTLSVIAAKCTAWQRAGRSGLLAEWNCPQAVHLTILHSVPAHVARLTRCPGWSGTAPAYCCQSPILKPPTAPGARLTRCPGWSGTAPAGCCQSPNREPFTAPRARLTDAVPGMVWNSTCRMLPKP